jgi:hypothetical protein
MKRLRDSKMSAEALGELEAIEATLTGTPVGPEHARLAELVRELRASRPAPRQQFVRTLDAKVAGGFAGEGGERDRRRRQPGTSKHSLRLLGISMPLRPALATALTALVAVAVAVPLAVSGGARHTQAIPKTSENFGRATSAGSALAAPAESTLHGDLKAPGAGTSSSAAAPNAGRAESRRIERGATLDVGVAPSSIESTSKQVFTIVSSLGGYVRQSNVSSGAPGQGAASFDVRVPSSNLSRAIAELSQLGHVRTENDLTNDVTEQFNSLQSSLGSYQRQRASLLRQLAAASEPRPQAALKARLRAVQRRISQLQEELTALRTRVNYSSLALTLTAEAPVGSKQGNLTPGAAARQAGQILEAALSVLVLCVAAVVPLAALVLAGWAVAVSMRRRLREQALDAS